MSTDYETRVIQGNELERAGRDEEAIAHFRALVADYPDNPRSYYEYGGAFDSAGHEAEAIVQYNRALELGLPAEYLPQIYLQLGSSLRNMGQLDEAVAMLQKAANEYPERPSLKVFLALAQETAGSTHDALTTLFELAVAHADTADMKRYARSIRAYIDDRR
jgi:tetratricopeptide (TPR) repeat protein